MSDVPCLVIQEGKVSFGDRILFDALDVMLYTGRRSCLVGRNGSGKSTLMKLLAGTIELDAGKRFMQPNFHVGFLSQEYISTKSQTVKEHILAGGNEARPVKAFEADAILDKLKLSSQKEMRLLSGGERRRADLARVLAQEPEILLLDEPTNHLDIGTIEWLEEHLKAYRGALFMISHDRQFLKNLTTETLWLERGKLRRLNKGYPYFENWSTELLIQEERALQKMDKKLAQEVEWLHRGVTARRRRNQGRLRRLVELRETKQHMVGAQGKISLSVAKTDSESKLVIEAHHVVKQFESASNKKIIAKDFSFRLLKGDRLGIIGNNGTGKTTLLQLLMGHILPDSGKIRHGANLKVAYSDQMRNQLKLDQSLKDNLCEHGGDHVTVQGKPRHVVGYLKDFLFSEKQVFNHVGTLSGGERNRLMLAKVLTVDANVLILDEPTNDLDVDTLDILEEVLGDYEGTLILVSHDRDFIDRTVTSMLVLEGDGIINSYVGGYSDYLRVRHNHAPIKSTVKTAHKPKVEGTKPPSSQKLSYKFEREQEELTQIIPIHQQKTKDLEAKLSDPNLYTLEPEMYHKQAQQLEDVRQNLKKAEERWLEIEMMRDEK